jgi:hypothetical protein
MVATAAAAQDEQGLRLSRKGEVCGMTDAEIIASMPEYFKRDSRGRVQPTDIPDIYGPGAVLNVGSVAAVTNYGATNAFTADRPVQWPGSRSQYVRFSFAVARNPTATDPNGAADAGVAPTMSPRTRFTRPTTASARQPRLDVTGTPHEDFDGATTPRRRIDGIAALGSSRHRVIRDGCAGVNATSGEARPARCADCLGLSINPTPSSTRRPRTDRAMLDNLGREWWTWLRSIDKSTTDGRRTQRLPGKFHEVEADDMAAALRDEDSRRSASRTPRCATFGVIRLLDRRRRRDSARRLDAGSCWWITRWTSFAGPARSASLLPLTTACAGYLTISS